MVVIEYLAFENRIRMATFHLHLSQRLQVVLTLAAVENVVNLVVNTLGLEVRLNLQIAVPLLKQNSVQMDLAPDQRQIRHSFDWW